jgi:hypothetical protein
VREYSSADAIELAPDPATAPVPVYWYRPARTLSAAAGMHRFLWDLHYQPLHARGEALPIAAVPHDTAPAPTSPWVMPGQYTAKLTVNGKSYSQPLTVRMDPRVKTPAPGLLQQFTLSKQLYDDLQSAQTALEQLRAVRAQVKERASADAALAAFDKKAAALEGQAPGPGGGRGGPMVGPDTLSSVSAAMTQLLNQLQGADTTPTTQLATAVADRRAALAKLMATWNTLKGSAAVTPASH